MTIKIPASAIPPGFDLDAAVRAHAKEWADWTAHDKLVKQGEADPYPPPVADPVIDAAVRRNEDGTFEPDYVLVDDGPTPEQILRQKKDALIAEVSRMENDAIGKALPLGKRRLLQITYNDAIKAASARAADTSKSVDEAMTADERAIVDGYNAIQQSIDRIQRAAAVVQDEIEDLTAETIDGYQVEPLAARANAAKQASQPATA